MWTNSLRYLVLFHQYTFNLRQGQKQLKVTTAEQLCCETVTLKRLHSDVNSTGVGNLVQPTDHKLIDGCTAEDTAAWRWQFPVGIASFLNCTLFDRAVNKNTDVSARSCISAASLECSYCKMRIYHMANHSVHQKAVTVFQVLGKKQNENFIVS